MLLPGNIIGHGLCGRMGGDPALEDDCADHEEAEEDDLDDETADDDVVSGAFGALYHDSSAFVSLAHGLLSIDDATGKHT